MGLMVKFYIDFLNINEAAVFLKALEDEGVLCYATKSLTTEDNVDKFENGAIYKITIIISAEEFNSIFDLFDAINESKKNFERILEKVLRVIKSDKFYHYSFVPEFYSEIYPPKPWAKNWTISDED